MTLGYRELRGKIEVLTDFFNPGCRWRWRRSYLNSLIPTREEYQLRVVSNASRSVLTYGSTPSLPLVMCTKTLMSCTLVMQTNLPWRKNTFLPLIYAKR